MYSLGLENKLISSDIAEMMQDYVSIQLDIDNTKIKAAALVAQSSQRSDAPHRFVYVA